MPESNDHQPKLPGKGGVYDKELDALQSLTGKTKPEDKKAPGTEDAASSEANALENMNAGITGMGAKLGRGFTGAMGGAAGAFQTAGAGGLARFMTSKASEHKKGIIAGGVLGGGLTGLIVFILGTLPFAFTSIMHAIEDKEMRIVKANVSQMQDSIASHYVKKYLLPGMKLHGCTSTIVDRNCAVAAEGDGFVARNFRAWQKGSIERKWAQNGFEIRYDRSADRYFVRATGMGEIDITRFTHTDGNLFSEINRRDVRALFQEAHEHSSKWDRMLTRFGWGKQTLRDNFRVTRCVLSCKILDAKEKYFTEPWQQKKTAFKIKLVQRVLLPKSEMYGLAFTCLFSGSRCDPNEPDINSETGEYRTRFESDIQTRITALLARDGGDASLRRAQEMVAELREKGFSKFLIETIVKSLLDKVGASEGVKQATAKFAGSLVPGVNLVIGLSSAISALSTIGPQLKSLNTQITEFSSAQMFGMDSVYANELQSANVDATEVGSFADSFSRGQELQPDGKTYGGASAGAVPLYNAVINDGAQTQSAFNGLFGTKTYAAANDPNHLQAYKCPISNRILDPSGKNGELICPEQSLKYSTYIAGAFGSVANFLNSPGISVVTKAANWVTGIIGDITGAITQPIVDLLQKSPLYQSITDSISNGAAAILQDFQSLIFPNWINDNMSGGTKFVADDLGARVVANDFAENVLRGQPLTLAQRQAIEDEATMMDEVKFKQKPLYARIFDKEDPHSFVTRLSLAMPTDLRTSVGSIFTQLISDPFSKLMRGFGAVFSGKRAFAGAPLQPDPFGLTWYGTPSNNSVYTADPEQYEATNCTGNTHSTTWNEHVTINPDLGTPEHQHADPCGLLIEATQMGGGLYDSSLVNK